jgi:hypothetical protein
MIDYANFAHLTLPHIDSIVRRFVDPDARRSGPELWFVDEPGYSSSNRTSASINLRNGKWHLRGDSTAAGTSGHDVVSLVAVMQSLPMHKAAEAVAEFIGIDVPRLRDAPATRHVTSIATSANPDDDEAIGRALEMWSAGEPWQGTLAETYLRNRSIDPSVIGDDELRFMQYCPLGRFATHPAMLCPIRDRVAGILTGVQRVFLCADGSGLRNEGGGVKRMVGRKRRSGIWFGSDAPEQVVMVEGPEDAMSIRTMRPTATVVATIDAGHMGKQALPGSVRQIVVIPDAGEAGDRGLAQAREAYQHLDLRIARLPLAMDANDLLRTGA